MISRILMAQTKSGEVEVPVILHAPIAGDGYWECQFEIDWPEGTRPSRSRGFDDIQVMYLAMQTLAVHLYASDYHARGDLRWGKPGAGYGFPMPVVGYPDLVGEDGISQVPS